MLSRWSRVAATHFSTARVSSSLISGDYSWRSYSEFAAAADDVRIITPYSTARNTPTSSPVEVNLNKMFWSKPCSLALLADSPLRVEEPKYEGIKHFMLKLMLFYSNQSKAIRGANVVYRRIVSQADKPAIYNVFSLEKTFKTTFSLLVIHMWLFLRRTKQEGKEGLKFGQYLYELHNHDVEVRVSKAGVNLLLHRWMKDLEKIFYGNIVAYDAAMLPEAKQEELDNVLWRNVFSDEGSSKPNDAGLRAVQAMSRYIRREAACLSLTDKEALLSGNFMFTSLDSPSQGQGGKI